MSSHYLHRFFQPGAVAVIGASERPGAVGTRVFANLLAGGLSGRVFPVNPRRQSVAGVPCVASVDALETRPDLAVICVAARHLPSVLESCGRNGVRAVLILSASLLDAGRDLKRIEEDALATARRHGIRVIGPDWIGLIRPPAGVNASLSVSHVRSGHLALVSQSGAISAAALDWAAERGIGFSTVVSLGDTRDVDFGDVLDFLATDAMTHSVLLFIETIGDARRFLSGLRAAARLKPVIVMKVGRRGEGQEAAQSHTGRLVAGDDAFSAALDRAGAVRVADIGQLFSAAELLASGRRLNGNRICIIANGGGPGIIATDRLVERGLLLAELADDTAAALAALMPPCGHAENPVNILGDADPERYACALRLCLTDPAVDGALVLVAPHAMTDPVATAEQILSVATSQTRPVLGCWLGGGAMRPARQFLTERRFPNFATPENGVEALAAMTSYRDSQRRLMQVATTGGTTPDQALEEARRIIDDARHRGQPRLTPYQSKQVIAAFGIPVIPTRVARSAEEAQAAAAAFAVPVAVKINSVAIAHKAEVGGVHLNVSTPAAAAQAWDDIMRTVREHYPDEPLDGVSVEPMHAPRNGHEVMLGVVRDPVFGPVLSFGAGGSMVEVIGDRAVALPPLNDALARDMLQRSRVGAYLGLAGASVQREQLEHALLRLSDLVAMLPEVTDVDINPVIIDDQGLVAVDARLHISDCATPPDGAYRHMAIMPYPAHLAQRETLSSGLALLIRPIRPDDADLEQRFFRSLSSQSRYFRFMEHIQELSTTALIRFTQIDYDREMALVALAADNPDEALGVARYVTNPDGRSCEFALAVADAWHGRGIGRRLMERLLRIAADSGLDAMEGEVLASNRPMLGLMQSLGFRLARDPDDAAVVRVERTLGGD